MIHRARQLLRERQALFLRTPFGCLLRLFVTRMFHGGGASDSQELDLGVGVILTLLAVPGLLVSLLMFEKYGSLIRYLRGARAVDPYSATTPDEYFFIVLSMVITGAAALWRWDAIFPDRRDSMNLVPLPIRLRTIFFANFCAILILVALFSVVVNIASLFLFPIAVFGSQGSFAVLFRFAAGHAVAVFLASAFSFFAVFALAGILMALLPAMAFRRVSLLARFVIAVCFLALLASSLTVPYLLTKLSAHNALRVALLPPVSFLGIARTVWGTGDPFSISMAKAALFASGLAVLIGIAAYALSFRRSFVRIPEVADVAPLPRLPFSLSPLAPVHKIVLRQPSLRACYHFVARTLLRSDAHLQIVLAFLAFGLVLAAETLASAPDLHSLLAGPSPAVEFLSIPFILSYCLIAGIRFAFEIPADLRANWIFRYALDAGPVPVTFAQASDETVPADAALDDAAAENASSANSEAQGAHRHDIARAVARRVLLMFSVSWLAPASFLLTLTFWGWIRALFHTAVVIACSAVLVEILLIRFRKVPFTCSPPPFQSYSGVILVAYLFGFLVFTDYIPQLEQWALPNPLQVIWFAPLLGIALLAVHQYRKQMLDMDKQLIFEEPSPSPF